MQTLLLVDDARLTQAIFLQGFAHADIEIVCCERASEALDFLAKQGADFIGISASLPDGSGIELIRKIRALPDYRYLPIALMTSEITEKMQADAQQADVSDIFLKQDVGLLINFFTRLIRQARPLRAHILYVEDSKAQAQLILAQLASRELTVDWKANAEDALTALATDHYDLVLTDINLGAGMDGVMFAKRIRRLEGVRGDIPVLAMTALDDASQRIGLFNIGINDYLVKPVIKEELIVRIRRLVERQRMLLEVETHKSNLEVQVAERTEQYLQVHEQMLTASKGMQELLDSMAEGAYGIDFEGNCTFVNQAFLTILHYQHADEVLGKDIHALIHHSHADGTPYPDTECKARISQALNQAVVVTDEVFWTLDGQAVPVEYRTNLIIKNGHTTGAITTFIDITDRKKNEAALLDSERQARRVAHELSLQKFALDQHAIVATTDVTGRINYVNNKFCEISGYTREELLGQDHLLLNSGHHPHGFFREMYRIVTTGEVWTGEVCNRAKDGHLYWVYTTIVPDMGEDGKPQRYVAIRADITQRKENELELERYRENLEALVLQQTEKLFESQRLWQFAVEGSGDGVWDWNIQTDEAIYSRRWKEMLGYADEDILPTNAEWQRRIHPDDRGYVAESMRAYLAGETKIYAVEYRLRCKDDSYKWIMGRGMIVNCSDDGQPLRMVGTHTDITEYKQNETALKSSESKFRSLYDSTSDAVMLLDEQGFIDCNGSTLALFGCATKEDFCIRSPGDLSAPEQPCGTNSTVLAAEHIAEAIRVGHFRFEWLIRRVDTGAIVRRYFADGHGYQRTIRAAGHGARHFRKKKNRDSVAGRQPGQVGISGQHEP